MSHSRLPVPAALLALLAVTLPGPRAQSLVLPVGAATAEQPGRAVFGEPLPLSPLGTRLHQVLYGASELAGAPAGTWNSLSLRPDAAGYPQADPVRILVQLSSLRLPEPGAMSVVDPRANRGSDATLVVRPRVLQLPAVASRRDGQPQPEIVIPFDVPFHHPGAGHGLLIEIGWERTVPGAVAPEVFDALRVLPQAWAIDRRVPVSGCAPAGRLSMTAGTSAVSRDLVLVVEYSGAAVDPGKATLFALGGVARSQPLDGLGAPGCVLGLVPALFAVPFNYPVPVGGVFWVPFTLGYDQALLGTRLFAQAAVLDPSANPLGLVVSDAIESRIVAGPAPSRAQWLTFVGSSARASANELDLLPVVVLR